MQVRTARIEDAHAIAHVHVTAWQTSYRGIVPDDLLDGLSEEQRTATRRKILQDPQRKFPTLVALEGGKVVGFADLGMTRDKDLPAGTMPSTCCRNFNGRDSVARYGLTVPN